MAYKLADRVRETTTTAGTGAIALGGAVSGFRTFASALATGDTTHYAIALGAQWEIGLGTLTAATTLARTTVLASSNNGALVSFDAGIKDVFVTAPAAWLQKTREMNRIARTSNVQITAANDGDLVDVTSGSFTQTFASAAALGSGFKIYYDNSGTGTVTLSGVTGLASVIPGALALIQSDGATLRGYVLNDGKGVPGGVAELGSNGKLPASQSEDLGGGQTWQAVTRNVNVSYQNATGKTILVAFQGATSGPALEVSANNSTFLRISRPLEGATGCAAIPPGYFYRWAVVPPSSPMELR